MKKLFPLSAGAIVRQISFMVCRFPIAVAAVVALATLALLAAHGLDDVINYRWPLWLLFTLLSSVAVTVALEERRSRLFCLLAGLGVALLWGVRCWLLPADEDYMTTVQSVEAAVMHAGAFGAIFCSAFLRRGGDAQWWNFALRTLIRLLLGGAFAAIFYIGLWLAVMAVQMLFNVSISFSVSAYLAIGCFVLFAPLYVLSGVPAGERKRDPELLPVPVMKVLGLYILGSILAVYTSILYVYLIRIVVRWELPDGGVSWLVTLLSAGGLVVTMLLYPHRMRGGNRVVDFLGRWMGVIIAPLLVLMTVGIARRLSDYGWTPNRAYILLVNLWFYGVYVWLFVVRGRRVKWILISAIVVAVLSSVGPWSLAGITPSEECGEDVVITKAAKDPHGGKWFSSENPMKHNTSYALAERYGKVAKIEWNGNSEENDGDIEFTEEGEELVIRIPVEGEASDGTHEDALKEFRIALRGLEDEKMFTGEGFALIVEWYSGIRYEDRVDSYLLQGVLLYN